MNTTLRALMNQAERLVKTSVFEEAVALCHAVLRRYPRYARCYRLLGEAYLGLAECEEAAKLFRRALGVDPEDPVAYAGLGIIFEERGLLEEAIWQLERAYELAPGRDELRQELCRLYERRGSTPYVQLTRAALARLYARAGLWNKAIGELRDLLIREPYRLDLRVTLARTLWRARQRDEAAQVAQTILDQAPNCLVARLILGTYWCQEGRVDEGRALLDGAQELDPENREAVRLLAKESPLSLRVARVETEAPIPADNPDIDQEEMTPWPEAPWPEAEEALPREEAAAWPAMVESGEEAGHIVEVPLEAVQGLLNSLAAQSSLDMAADEGEPPAPELGDEEGAISDGPPDVATSQAADPAVDEPEAETTPAVLSPVAIRRRELETRPDDPEAKVELARALANSDQVAEALALYDGLATPATGYLDRVLADLKEMVTAYPDNRAVRELMGDAYARAGRFEEAMEMYRWLLAQDEPSDLAGG